MDENSQALLKKGIAFLQEASTEQDNEKTLRLFLKATEMGVGTTTSNGGFFVALIRRSMPQHLKRSAKILLPATTG